MELLTLILLTLWTLWTTTGGEWSPPVSSHVSCVFMETCLLPCSFKPGDLAIAWSKDRMTVHYFDQGKDEPEKQDASFRGRTSLFPEQFSVGNTSMQMFKVTLDDEGIYHCFVYDRKTEDGKEAWMSLRVESPVKAVSMEQKGDVLVCSSEGIFPQPNVSWAPPSRHKTQIEPMPDRRFSVTSSLSLDVQPPQQHSCNISTDHSWKSTTYSLQPPLDMSSNITIPCVDSMVPEKSLVWTFNYMETIVIRIGAEVAYTAPWRPFVEGVSERGSLSLKELSQEQEGVYVCELHTDDTTYISRTVLGHTAPEGLSAAAVGASVSAVISIIIILLLIIIIIIIIVIIVIIVIVKKKREEKARNTEEENPLLKPKSVVEINLEETLGGLSEDELHEFQRLLMDQSEMNELVISRAELETDLSKALIEALGVRSISVTKRLLQELQKNHLVEKLIYDPEEILKACKNKMKSELRQRFEFLSEGVSSRRQMEFSKGYTELFITEGDSGRVNEEHEVRQMERDSRRSGQEKTVLCQDIFKDQRGKPIRAVLTKGVAGAGKTVLTQKVSLDWAEGRENQEVELLFHFTFRELNELRGSEFSLVELLHHCFSQIKHLFSFNGLQLLFIFDGLDECSLPLDFSIRTKDMMEPTESASVEELLVNLIRGNLLPSARLWITTRPAAANQIPEECVSMVTEVRGFSDEQKEQYFRNRFTDEAPKVISHIKTSRSLFIMCHLPVICWIISDVLLHLMKNKKTEDLPTTLTEMYVHFLVVQVKVKNKKYEGQEESDDPWTEETRKMVKSLGKLAFEKLQNGKLIFSQSDLSECGLKAEEIAQSGVFTQVFREQPGQGLKKVYCFIHLSVQEFLAALYVHQTFTMSGINLSEPSFMRRIFRCKRDLNVLHRSAVDQALQSPNGHLDLFLRFLLGLSLPTNQKLLEGLLTETGSDQTNQRTVKYIKKKLNKRGVSAERSLNLLHCLNELNDRSLVEEIQKVMREGGLSDRDVSPADLSTLSFLLLSSDSDLEHFDLRKYRPSEEGLLGLLPVVKASTKVTLSCCGLTSHCCGPLASVLSSSSLTLLDLSNNDLQDSGVELLCEGLKSAPCRLDTLSLSLCGLTSDCCGPLASMLSSSSLKHLDLSNNDLQNSGVELLCEGLKSAPCRLDTLSLSLCGLTSRCCGPDGPLVSVLSSSSLTLLDLSINDLQDSGVELLCEGLKSAPCRLDTLRLSGCMVTERGGASLAAALSSAPFHLTDLDLSYNHPGSSREKLTALQRPPQTLRMDPSGEKFMVPGLRKYACEFSLDCNTLHKHLLLSEDLRSVTHEEVQSYPDHIDRFTDWPQVLSSSGLRGRCYWEVDWSLRWWFVVIAVSYRGIRRRGGGDESGFGNNDRSWSLRIDEEGDCCVWHNNNRTILPGKVGVSSGRVGVFLDWEGGALSFYDVTDGGHAHLYTFSSDFTEELFPGFGLRKPGSSVTVVDLTNQRPPQHDL